MQFTQVNDRLWQATCQSGDAYEIRKSRGGIFTIYMNGEDFSARSTLDDAIERATDHAAKMPGNRARRKALAEAKAKALSGE